MTRPSSSQPSPLELLERGRLTLQAIQYHERAARFKAAAASLQAAMVQAENGDADTLQAWLEQESHQLDCDLQGDLLDAGLPSRSLRLDPDHAVLPRTESPRIEIVPDRNPQIGQDVSQVETLNIESPWARMEKAASERLENASSSLPPAVNDLTNKAESLQQAKPTTLFDSDPLSKALSTNTADFTTEEISDELRILLSEIDLTTETHRSKQWWKAPHVWISLFVHLILVVCLSVVAITVASEPKIFSIVSATVEAENVLLETPMEMVSELEVMSEPEQSTPAPNLSDLVTDIALSSIPLETGSLPSPPPSISKAISGASSDSAAAAMVGSKMLTGAEFFGVKATGNTFVYIVDSSPSMRRDGAFDAARDEIVRSLKSMKPKQRYFISFFGKEVDPMVLETGVVERYPVYAKPENLTKTIDWLSFVQIQKEGLPPNNALDEAIGMRPDGIFLLFDGDTKVDVAKFLRSKNRTDDILNMGTPKVPIHVVHFYQDEFQKQMRQVAEENGGTYRFVPRPERPSKSNR